MAQNHIQWQNPPIFNPCLEAAEILTGNVLALPSQWLSGAAGMHPTPYGRSLLQKHITDVENVKEQAPSTTALGQRRAKNKTPGWKHPWGICLPVLCLDFRIDLWFLLIVRNVETGEASRGPCWRSGVYHALVIAFAMVFTTFPMFWNGEISGLPRANCVL